MYKQKLGKNMINYNTDLQHYHITKITTLKDHFLTRETLKGSPETTYETRTLCETSFNSTPLPTPPPPPTPRPKWLNPR